MSFDLSIVEMLNNYPNSVPYTDRLREILQQTALLGLSRHQFFEHAAFYGGTALRILYGLDRYSEDLDFSLVKRNSNFDFSPFLNGMRKELIALGFDLDVNLKKKSVESAVASAFIKANTFSMILSITRKSQNIHPDQKIQIKLEVDTDPPPIELKYENKLVKNPFPFYVSTFQLPDLFAGKMHAMLCRPWQKRIKGRDWYDAIWYIQKGVSINLAHLIARMRQTGHLGTDELLTPDDLRERLRKKIDSIDWPTAKADVAPFIQDNRRLDIWSSQFFCDMMEHLSLIE